MYNKVINAMWWKVLRYNIPQKSLQMVWHSKLLFFWPIYTTMDAKLVRFQLVITIYVLYKVRTLAEGKTCNSFWLFRPLLTDILKIYIEKLFISNFRVNTNYELNLAEVFSFFKVMMFSCFYSIWIYELQQNPHTFSKNKINI